LSSIDNNRGQLQADNQPLAANYNTVQNTSLDASLAPDIAVPTSQGVIASPVTSDIVESPATGHDDVQATPARPRSRRIRMPGNLHTFDSFRYRNYRFVWATTLFSSGGFWMQQIVIGWLMYDITQSAFLTTLAMGLDALPILLVGPIGGLLVDSWDRRKLLAGIYAYQATVTSVFATLVLAGYVGPVHIFGYIMMMGVGWVILDPARASLVSTTVPGESLVNAFALNSLGFSVTRLAAPAIGGGLLALVGPGPALVIEAVLQGMAAIAALAIRLPQTKRAELRIKTAFSRLLEGALYVKGQPIILSVIALSIVPPMMSFPFLNGLMPVFAAEVFETGSVGLGLLMSSLGAGSVMGTLVLASVGNVKYKGRLIILSIALTSLTMLAFSQVTSLYFAFPILIVSSVGMMVFFSTASALVQSIVPDEFRGRVTSISMFSFGMMPIGSLTAGILAQRLGAPTAMMIAAGVVAFLLGAFLLNSRLLWRT
jgi:MFS family permease